MTNLTNDALPSDTESSLRRKSGFNWRILQVAAVVSIAITALLLRATGLSQQSLSMDEEGEIARASLPVAKVIMVQDRFPPLYHLTLHGWQNLFDGPLAARWLSVIYGLAALPVIAGIAYLVVGARAAWFTSAMIAVSPIHIHYSQEIRAYSLIFLLASLVVFSVLRSVYGGKPTWVLFVTSSVAGIYTHYYFPLLLLAILLSVLFSKGFRCSLRPLCVSFAVVAICCLPAAWLLILDMSHPWGHARNSSFSLAAVAYTYFGYLVGYGLGPSTRELHALSSTDAMQQFLPWGLCIMPSVGLLFVTGIRRLQSTPFLLLLLLIAVLPVVVIGSLSLFSSFGYNVRHTLWALLPIVIVLGAGISSLRTRTAAIAWTPLLVLCFLSIYNRAYVDRYRNEDVQALGEFLESETASGERLPVFVIAGYMAQPVRYYLSSEWQVTPLPDVDENGNGLADASKELREHSSLDKDFWLVYSRPFHGDPAQYALEAFVASPQIAVKEFAGIQLYRGTMEVSNQSENASQEARSKAPTSRATAAERIKG